MNRDSIIKQNDSEEGAKIIKCHQIQATII